MSPDFKLVVDCIRVQCRGGQLPNNTAIHDPDDFLRLLRRHRVVPQAYAALSACQSAGIPRTFMARLDVLYREVVASNLRLIREVVRINRKFTQDGIHFIQFKGPSLAIQLYGGLNRRQFIDLDLLVRPGDLQKSLQAMKELGYAANGPDIHNATSRRFDQIVSRFNEHGLFLQEGKVKLPVDLHWRYEDDPDLFVVSHDELFENCSHYTVAGEDVATLSSNHRLAYLALHACHHRFMRLSWVSDFACAAALVPDNQWETVLGEQSSLGRRVTIASLLVLEEVELIDSLDSRIPDVARWRRKLRNITSQSCSAVTADEAIPLNGALHVGLWRWKLTGKIRPLLTSLARSTLPKQTDLLQTGTFGPHISRWKDLATRACPTATGRKRGIASEDSHVASE
ncbi:MAG: nucleotidyltransferase domain-containing protein [Planctomycetales bacterium]